MTGGDVGSLIGGLAALAATVLAVVRWIIPWWKQHTINNMVKEANERAIRDVIVGRPGGAPNAITGENGTPPLPGLAQRMNEVFDRIAAIEKVVSNSTITRIERVEEITTELAARVDFLYKELRRHHPDP